MSDFNVFNCSCAVVADGTVTNTVNGNFLYRTRIVINGYKEEDRDFYTLKAWGKLGQTMDKHFKKGTQIMLSGRLQIEKSVGDDKVERIYPTITAESFTFMSRGGPKPTSDSEGESVVAADATQEADIPF